MKKYILLSMFMVCLFAVSAETHAQWSMDRTIASLNSGQAGGRTSIKLVGEQPNPYNCTYGFDLYFDQNNPRFSTMWSIVVLAFTMDIPIDVHIQGCAGSPYNLPLVTDVQLRR